MVDSILVSLLLFSLLLILLLARAYERRRFMRAYELKVAQLGVEASQLRARQRVFIEQQTNRIRAAIVATGRLKIPCTRHVRACHQCRETSHRTEQVKSQLEDLLSFAEGTAQLISISIQEDK